MIGGVEHSLQHDGGQEDQAAHGEQQQDAQHKRAEQDEARVIYIRALMRGLDAAFVPFALLKHDPFVAVQEYVATHKQRSYEQNGNGRAERERAIAQLVYMRNAWNSLFRELRIDQLFFLCAWNSVPGASLNTVRAAGLSFMIATPGTCRWLVTRPVWWHNELVVWCEAIDTTTLPSDGVPEIVLSERNMLWLKSFILPMERGQ